MDNVKIIDNFLSPAEFGALRSSMLSTAFPWNFTPMKVSKVDSDDELTKYYNFQNYHLFYGNGIPQSTYFNVLSDVLIKINPAALIKIKANLTTRTTRVIKSSWHVDNTYKNSTTAVFYLNTNNGFTFFKDGSKVESVENRLVTFPSSLIHAGTTSSDTDYRAVINLNYFLE